MVINKIDAITSSLLPVSSQQTQYNDSGATATPAGAKQHKWRHAWSTSGCPTKSLDQCYHVIISTTTYQSFLFHGVNKRTWRDAGQHFYSFHFNARWSRKMSTTVQSDSEARHSSVLASSQSQPFQWLGHGSRPDNGSSCSHGTSKALLQEWSQLQAQRTHSSNGRMRPHNANWPLSTNNQFEPILLLLSLSRWSSWEHRLPPTLKRLSTRAPIPPPLW